jgi:hypothetical protein
MARKVMGDGTLCGYERGTTNVGGEWGVMHFPSFSVPLASFCTIPDCPCRDIKEWKAHNPAMTRYRVRWLRKHIAKVEQRYGLGTLVLPEASKDGE